VLLTSFCISFIRLSVNNTWHKIYNVPLHIWAAGIGGFYFANVCFVFALQYAPPENIELISYLWPILIIFLAPLYLKTQIRLNHVLGSIIAFWGIFLLLGNTNVIGGQLQYWKGYVLTAGYLIFWTAYIISSIKYPKAPNELVGIFCGIGALLSFLFHLLSEEYIAPNQNEIATMILIGITGQGLAYLFWDYSIKHGHYYFLCILSNFTPLLSIFILIQFGFTAPRENLSIAAILVCSGTLITSINIHFWKKYFKPPIDQQLKNSEHL
jgi:drug/metabolite transporter (DMT)-like permease